MFYDVILDFVSGGIELEVMSLQSFEHDSNCCW
jgi:hypothetical protein